MPPMNHAGIPSLSEFAGAAPSGLTEVEARERLRKYGANELNRGK
ncbi:MAG: hypothetical protein JNM63_16540, partial [Spirochaetia bacterium]|nr:hypothetical protein [Spirochaetia bacterium]